MAQHIVPIMMMEEEDSGYSDSGSEELSPQAVYNNRHDSYFPPYQTLNGDIDSPNDMQVDSEEFLNGNENEKNEDEVAEISPDEGPQADDFEAMKELVLTPLTEQPPIIEDVVNTWHIENWSNLPRRHHGPTFECGGHPWRVLMFPQGNNVDFASFYLEHGYDEHRPMPEDFVCTVQFGLVLWNPDFPSVFTHHVAHHRFTAEEGDWGFTRFIEQRKLWGVPWDKSGRFMAEGEQANMTAYVRVVKDETGVLWHNFNNYDSKKETGFVGLKNQGATCYLNSLIQSLYFTNAFRKAVYDIPTQNEDAFQNSAYTLQRLFYQLQTSNTAVGTNELTKSFGWETRHIFEQQDVQELSRKLMERMEEKMKGTEAENVLPRLFSGKVRTYISCINVEYESARSEEFWDIQLNVSGNRNVEESFKDYVQVEVMDGENQYFAGEQFKLQDARKGVIFESFPEVLHLQLKRFQYDIDRDQMMKINDRYEFPESFDAAPYLTEKADLSEPWIYQLHGVLVHSGDLNAGHYYAFIKPEKDGWFYKYDDDRVTRATMREVLDDNYGGELISHGVPVMSKGKPVMRQSSAYMLVYIRQSRVENVLLPVGQDDTPAHLQKKLDEEAALRQQLKKERDEQHLYLNVRVVTEDTFRAHGGVDLTLFDTRWQDNKAAARSYRLLRKLTMKELAAEVGNDINTDPKLIRFWCMVNRQNKTVRPDTPIVNYNLTLEEAYHQLAGSKGQDLRLWAEVAEQSTPEREAIWPATPGTAMTPSRSDLIVLFLKYFDFELQEIRGLGHVYISKDKKVEDLVPLILKKMDWPHTVTLMLYEEIKPSMIEPMKAKQTLKAAELQDGDIICFQPATTNGTDGPELSESSSIISKSPPSSILSGSTAVSKSSIHAPPRVSNAKSFYDFLITRKEVWFEPHPIKTPNVAAAPTFSLALSSKLTYDQLAGRVANNLQVDPTHLRFWTINATTGAPKATVKRGQGQNLGTILQPPYSTYSNNSQRNNGLMYEVLDISLAELDTKKSIKVTFLSEGISKAELYDVLVAKNGTVDDLIQALIKKAQLEDEVTAGVIDLYETHNHKIHKELSREATVINVADYTHLIAERVPAENLEDEQGEAPQTIYAYHFQGEPSKSHGIPFKFRVIPGEKFIDTKKRLEKRTGFKGKNFEKIKFALVKRNSYAKPHYLADDDEMDEMIATDDFLGLDHIDRSRVTRNGAGDLFLK